MSGAAFGRMVEKRDIYSVIVIIFCHLFLALVALVDSNLNRGLLPLQRLTEPCLC